jgi:hypothetical protein
MSDPVVAAVCVFKEAVMKTTTYTWTKNLAAMLLSCCLAVALTTPSVALARNRVAIDSPDATGSQTTSASTGSRLNRPAADVPAGTVGGAGSASATSGASRSQPRFWSPLARMLAWLLNR